MATESATALAHPTVAAAPSRHSVNCVPVLAADRVLLHAPRCSLLATLTPLLWLAALAAGCPRGPVCHRSSPRQHRAACRAALLLKAACADPPATAALPAGIALPAALPCC
eukprot:jgi/Tetstr1/431800/TSEL_021295.t1